MDIRQENKPLCKCHNHPMYWNPNRNRKNGGHWRCHIKFKAARFRENNSIKGYVRRRIWYLKRNKESIINQLKELENNGRAL